MQKIRKILSFALKSVNFNSLLFVFETGLSLLLEIVIPIYQANILTMGGLMWLGKFVFQCGCCKILKHQVQGICGQVH